MTPLRRRVLRIVGAIAIVLGVAIAWSAVSTVFWAYVDASQCPPGDASCREAAPFLLRLAMLPGGLGVFVVGLGLLVRNAGRERPGDTPFVFTRPVVDRATKYRAAVTALTLGAAAACWALGLDGKLWGLFAVMGAIFALTSLLMQTRKLL